MAELRKFISAKSPHAVLIEADGRTVYAYLVDVASRILGDVWLANIGDTPEQDEWASRGSGKQPPFKNGRRFVLEGCEFAGWAFWMIPALRPSTGRWAVTNALPTCFSMEIGSHGSPVSHRQASASPHGRPVHLPARRPSSEGIGYYADRVCNGA